MRGVDHGAGAAGVEQPQFAVGFRGRQLDDAERFSLNPGQPDFRCADLAVDAVRFLSSDVDVLKESKKQAVPSS